MDKSYIDPVAKRHIPEDLYHFGGTEQQVRQYQQRFLQYFSAPGPVLDIGCGRGTFLELLAERGIEPLGVDSSRKAVALCHSCGFRNVYEADAVTFLSQSKCQFSGIYCGHVIEHMYPAAVHELLRLCWLALRPGGTIVLVTPNPLDLQVMGEFFWLDLTHVRPYPYKLLLSMLQEANFDPATGGHFRGSRPPGRHMARYFLLRVLLGKHYGLENTFVVARKPVAPI